MNIWYCLLEVCFVFNFVPIICHCHLETRFSIQGVKSLGGDCIVFPILGTGDTDRWRINLCLCVTCQNPRCPISEKRRNPPKWFNSLDTNSTWNSTIVFYRPCCAVLKARMKSGSLLGECIFLGWISCSSTNLHSFIVRKWINQTQNCFLLNFFGKGVML